MTSVPQDTAKATRRPDVPGDGEGDKRPSVNIPGWTDRGIPVPERPSAVNWSRFAISEPESQFWAGNGMRSPTVSPNRSAGSHR